jgi:hypothetical protein
MIYTCDPEALSQAQTPQARAHTHTHTYTHAYSQRVHDIMIYTCDPEALSQAQAPQVRPIFNNRVPRQQTMMREPVPFFVAVPSNMYTKLMQPVWGVPCGDQCVDSELDAGEDALRRSLCGARPLDGSTNNVNGNVNDSFNNGVERNGLAQNTSSIGARISGSVDIPQIVGDMVYSEDSNIISGAQERAHTQQGGVHRVYRDVQQHTRNHDVQQHTHNYNIPTLTVGQGTGAHSSHSRTQNQSYETSLPANLASAGYRQVGEDITTLPPSDHDIHARQGHADTTDRVMNVRGTIQIPHHRTEHTFSDGDIQQEDSTSHAGHVQIPHASWQERLNARTSARIVPSQSSAHQTPLNAHQAPTNAHGIHRDENGVHFSSHTHVVSMREPLTSAHTTHSTIYIHPASHGHQIHTSASQLDQRNTTVGGTPMPFPTQQRNHAPATRSSANWNNPQDIFAAGGEISVHGRNSAFATSNNISNPQNIVRGTPVRILEGTSVNADIVLFGAVQNSVGDRNNHIHPDGNVTSTIVTTGPRTALLGMRSEWEEALGADVSWPRGTPVNLARVV